VERPENNGLVNIVLCTVVFSSGQSIKLSGGETGTVSVARSPFWVQAFSLDPYNPQRPDPRAWRSHRVKILLKPDEVIRLSVEPRSKGSAYVGGWTVERAANELGRVHAECAVLWAFDGAGVRHHSPRALAVTDSHD
jgi:hypothetical protein